MSDEAGDYGGWKVELRHPILAILDERCQIGVRHRPLPRVVGQVRCPHHGTHLTVSFAGRPMASRALLAPSEVDELGDVVVGTLLVG